MIWDQVWRSSEIVSEWVYLWRGCVRREHAWAGGYIPLTTLLKVGGNGIQVATDAFKRVKGNEACAAAKKKGIEKKGEGNARAYVIARRRGIYDTILPRAHHSCVGDH